MSKKLEATYVVTSAPVGHSVEQGQRMRLYLISMSIRVITFLLAIIISHPIRWFLILLAVLLPYIAVVKANTASGASSDLSNLLISSEEKKEISYKIN